MVPTGVAIEAPLVYSNFSPGCRETSVTNVSYPWRAASNRYLPGGTRITALAEANFDAIPTVVGGPYEYGVPGAVHGVFKGAEVPAPAGTHATTTAE